MEPNIFHSESVLGEGPYASVIRSFGGVNPFGKLWFVNTTTTGTNPGSDDNGGRSYDKPLATLARALAVAAAGDTIVLAPGTAIAPTTAITISLASLRIVGIGRGTAKPTITVSGAVDGLNITGANVVIENIHFAAPATDEATAMINIAAAGVTLRGITGIGSGSSKNFVDCITIASGADDLTIEDCEIFNSNTAVNSFLSIEAAVARFRLKNVFFFGDVATAGIIDGAAATQLNWDGVVVGVVGTTKPAVTLDSNPTGLIRRSRFSGTHGTLATNAALGNAIRLFDVLLLEETDGSAQGAQIPAVDVN